MVRIFNLSNFLAAILFSIASTYSQSSPIKGIIIDASTQEALSFASVVQYHSDEIKGFATTTTDGEYEIDILDIDSAYCQVTFSFLSYQSDTIDCHHLHNIDTIKLVPISNHIEEIKITAYKRGVIINGDTTTYNPEVFSHGQEKNLKEIVEKLPGIQINEDGSIKANGQNVDQVLIEDDGFMNENKSQLLEGLSGDDVESIELIQNYSNGQDVFQFAGRNEQLALNIKLKDKGKGSLQTTMEGGIGIEERYDLDLKLHKINRHEKHFFKSFLSNTGERRLGIGDYVSFQGNQAKKRKGNTAFLNSIPQVFRNTYQLPYQSFNGTSLNYNFSLKPNLKINHQGTAYYYRPQFNTRVDRFILPGSNALSLSESARSEVLSHYAGLKWNTVLDTKNKHKYKFSMISFLEKVNESNFIDGVINDQPLDVDYTESRSHFTMDGQFEYSYDLSADKKLSFLSYVNIQDQPNEIGIDRSNLENVTQRTEQDLFSQGSYISFRRFKLTNEYQFDIGYDYQKSENHLQQMNSQSATSDQEVTSIWAEGGYGYFTRHLDFTVKLKLNSMTNHISSAIEDKVLLLPKVNLVWRLSYLMDLEFRVEEEAVTLGLNKVLDNELIVNPYLDNIFMYNNGVGRKRTLSMMYKYRNPEKGYSIIANMRYITSQKWAISDVYNADRIVQSYNTNGFERTFWSGVFYNIDFYKSFLSVRGFLTYVRGDELRFVESSSSNIRFNALSKQFSLFTRFDSRLNYEIKNLFTTNSLTFGNSASRSIQYTLTGNIIGQVSKLQFKLGNGLQYSAQTDRSSVAIYNLSGELFRLVSDRFRVGIEWNNLLHLDGYTYLSNTITGNILSSDQREILGGYIILKARLDF